MKRKKASAKPSAVPKEKPFFRPFEAVAKEVAAKQAAAEADAKHQAKASGRAVAAPVRAPVPVPRAKPSAPSVSDDDMSFAQLFYGVAPLDKASRSRVPRTVDPVEPRQAFSLEAADEAVRAHLRELVEGGRDTRFEVSDDGRRIEGRRTSIDAGAVRKLRRGELPIDVRIDLHGLAAGAAREALGGFLQRARAARERVALVVHGKGEHSPGGVGVLRGEVAAWLSQGEASAHVDAFATAVREDGGEGALYVLLRT